jgi:hypothetical protein
MSLKTEQSEPQSRSYLMRLWRTDKGKAWRVMLECVDTHERHGFANIEDLDAFLCEQMNGKSESRR